MGKIIAIYGINNIGKTTQVNLLKDNLVKIGKTVISFKYPIYNLLPTGPRINAYLREGNPENLSATEAQELYAINRMDSREEILNASHNYDYVILEDYVGTGIAWGMGRGVSREYLLEINKDLLKEDVSILMDGERFLEGKELNHKNENDSELIAKVRQIHLDLAKEYNWKIVNANQSIESVGKDILDLILK
jgi:dTMP kinase